jgi:hypothetical protein
MFRPIYHVKLGIQRPEFVSAPAEIRKQLTSQPPALDEVVYEQGQRTRGIQILLI